METTAIHFLHGSIPKKAYKDNEPTMRGGLLGGHIYIQIKNKVYGFEPVHDKNFHIFPRSNPYKYNSMLKKEEHEKWMQFAKDQQFTSIEIKVSEPRYRYLKNIIKKYKNLPPFDYALLGMRCASFTHYLLTKAQVCHSAGVIDSIIRYPYPRKLRKNLTKKALKKGWNIIKTKGSERRIWENDDHFLRTIIKGI
jgi:hypothetical protein